MQKKKKKKKLWPVLHFYLEVKQNNPNPICISNLIIKDVIFRVNL